jgi:hypothetical protein
MPTVAAIVVRSNPYSAFTTHSMRFLIGLRKAKPPIQFRIRIWLSFEESNY